MEGYAGTVSPPGMYVRVLYEYAADDPTSLNLRKGDIVQVLTQLDSGWWDGIIHGVRGWFPSNYCTLISSNSHRGDASEEDSADEADVEAELEDDYEDQDINPREEAVVKQTGRVGGHTDQEEAAFWIPQATPDGRLFYFNTLTGDSTMELPLETPLTANEAPPRENTNAFAADLARPPMETAVAGYERDEETDHSTSEAEATSRSSAPRRRSPYVSNGASPASPATSMGSLIEVASPEKFSPPLANVAATPKPRFVNDSSFIGTPTVGSRAVSVSQRMFTGSEPLVLTWDRIVEDMRRSIERYRQVVNRGESGDYVSSVEDVSDHLRLLLAAGSSTTDNHSGNPSIISSNKALYPRFRDMMSRFSKLVLSSHIAAADLSGGDTRFKCLQEADGVLEAVYAYVEVARQQRGEEIPRLFPGFVGGQLVGGNWRGNAVAVSNSTDPLFDSYEDDETYHEPDRILGVNQLDRIAGLEVAIAAASEALESRLHVVDVVISHQKHQRLSDDICAACEIVHDAYRPWMTSVESLNLSVLSLRVQSQQMSTFEAHKQKVYMLIADLIFACQAIAAPLADEWALERGESLDDRLKRVHSIMRQLRVSTSDVHASLRAFYESLPSPSGSGDKTHSVDGQQSQTSRNMANRSFVSQTSSFADSVSINAESSKIKRFFGEVPVTSPARTPQQEEPWFLQLDHEIEVVYDEKTNPPTVRGGTMTGLVEQLTRHDRYDSPFNNTFLLTYQSFTTAQELFELLIRRWNIQPPSGLSQEEYSVWASTKQFHIRVRITNVLKAWVDQYWMEGSDPRSRELIQRIYNFARDTVATSGMKNTTPLIVLIEQRMRGEETATRRLVPNSSQEVPASVLPKNLKKLKLLDIDPLEFARQLTIIESRLYGKIKPPECLNKIWQRKNTAQESESAANVKALILHSNRLTNWVAEMVLMQQDIKKRVAVIKHFVSIADKCLNLYNFSTLTSIISAFATAPITRLTRTWNQVSAKSLVALEKLRKLMSSHKNFAMYREALHLAPSPCIPFFGVYLTDLTFIEDGISSVIKKTDLINFSKRAKTAEVIREIQTYQNATYPYKSIPELQDYILSMMQAAGDVHEMYDRSLKLEPREREDEKIARLLSESGFL